MASLRNKFFALGMIVASMSSVVGTQAEAALSYSLYALEGAQFSTLQREVNRKVDRCRQKFDVTEDLEYRDCLKDAMLIPLARRNQDDATAELFFDVFQREIDEALRPGAADLVLTEALNGAKDENNSPKERATYYMVVENLLKLLPKKEMYRPVFEKAKNSEVEIGEEAVQERLNRLGLKTPPVSAMAEIALEQLKPDGIVQETAKADLTELEQAFE